MLVMSLLLQTGQVIPGWLGVAGLTAAAGALLWLGALSTKVDHTKEELEKKVGREEFTTSLNGLAGHLDDIHEDVREIRRHLQRGE